MYIYRIVHTCVLYMYIAHILLTCHVHTYTYNKETVRANIYKRSCIHTISVAQMQAKTLADYK